MRRSGTQWKPIFGGNSCHVATTGNCQRIWKHKCNKFEKATLTFQFISCLQSAISFQRQFWKFMQNCKNRQLAKIMEKSIWMGIEINSSHGSFRHTNPQKKWTCQNTNQSHLLNLFWKRWLEPKEISLSLCFPMGLIFTHPCIFRRFRPDISWTVALRKKLKKRDPNYISIWV